MGLVGTNIGGGLSQAEQADIYNAIQALEDGKAPIESPAFTGTPNAPTPPAGDDSGLLATTAFVQQAVLEVIQNIPGAGGIIRAEEEPEGNPTQMWVRIPDNAAFTWAGEAWVPIVGAFAE